MAEGVRKSSRIKQRTSYTEDDFDYELHLDVYNDISDVYGSNKKKTSKNSKGKSIPQTSKKSNKEFISDDQDVKSNSKKDQRAFGHVIANAADEKRTAVNSDRSHYGCVFCNKVFVSEQTLEEHMNQHQRKDDSTNGCLVCETCNRICINQTTYDKHMKLHLKGRKFKCDICEKYFTDNCNLKRHMRSHDSDRPFTCDLCFKSFRDNPTLIRHHKTHTERPRTYQCQKCEKSFTDKHGLKRHERIHSGLRPFECTSCSKCFSDTGSFKRHLKIHSGVRDFFCSVCKKTFIEKQSLVRHQKNVCGFGDLPNMADDDSTLQEIYESNNSCISEVENFESSRTSLGEGMSRTFNESSVFSDGSNTSTHFSAAQSVRLGFKADKDDIMYNRSSNEEPNMTTNLKDTPSLRSLVLKDPNLYKRISGIVDSIDSYEKMMDLCGETGQSVIDEALNRNSDTVLNKDTHPLADNMMCFECGEPLVNGENFRTGWKNGQSGMLNSLKCLNCEEDNVTKYEEPPVLIAEVPDKNLSILKQSRKEKEEARDTGCLNFFGAEKTFENVKKRLTTHHGVLEKSGGDSDNLDTADRSCSNAIFRSDSTDSEVAQTLMGKQSPLNQHGHTTKLELTHDNIDTHNKQTDMFFNKSSMNFKAHEEQPKTWTNVTPKLDYEVGDPNIPSVFPCHLCTKVFSTSSFLSRHLDLHKNSPHKCMVCDKTFTNTQSLKRHMNTHTGKKPYACPFCKKRFRDPSNFYKHKKVCSTTSASSSVDVASTPSFISSPQTLEDSAKMENVRTYVTNLKQKQSYITQPANSDSTPVPANKPTRFGYDGEDDNDEDEDLPVSFAHPSVDPDFPENGLTTLQENATSWPGEGLSYNDRERFQKETEQTDMVVDCAICEKTFDNELDLETHMKYHSGDPKVTCIECGKIFTDQFGLKRHMRIHAGIRPHVCEYCDRGYCDSWSLRKHKTRGCMLNDVKVPPDFLHPCSQCTRVFSEMDYLEEHMKSHRGLLKFECDICQKRFSEAFNLKRHRRLHLAICPCCDKEFKDIQSLADHRNNECSVEISQSTASGKDDGFQCTECGRVYSTKAYLERHKKFHSDFRPFGCEICSKRFSEAFRLRRHLKVHINETGFYNETVATKFTDVANTKQTKTGSSLNMSAEQQVQYEPVDYPCSLCDKIFTKSYLLTRHMNVHSQIRPFACNECERTYKDTSSLRRHQLVHQGIKNFVCSVCEKDFYYADSLKRHMTGSCGKKVQSACRRTRSQHRLEQNANNNTNMKNNNTIGKDLLSQDSKSTKMTSGSHNSFDVMSLVGRVFFPEKDIKTDRWSCYRKKHCWRCHLKFQTNSSFLKHSRIHCHLKPYRCPHCFIRLSRKTYLAVHLLTHKNKAI